MNDGKNFVMEKKLFMKFEINTYLKSKKKNKTKTDNYHFLQFKFAIFN